MLERRRDGMRERKINLKLSSRTPSLLQDCPSLSGTFGFNCGIRVQCLELLLECCWKRRIELEISPVEES
jgi:hypothetical protein